LLLSQINVRKYRWGIQKVDNPGKLTTQFRQEKQNKNTTQYVLDTTIRKQTQTT